MKTKLLALLIIITQTIYSQVTTNPAVPAINKEFTITFDATSTPLENYTGKVYAHTGVTVDSKKWQNVIGDWGVNTAQPELTRDSNNSNLYSLQITPNIHSFFGVETSKQITELSLVIRSSDGSLKNGPDIFIPIFSDGLNVAFTSPTNNTDFDLNENTTLTAESTIAADLEILVDNISIKTVSNLTSITANHTFNTSGNHVLKVIATEGSEVKSNEINIYIKTATQNISKPIGVKNGINIHNDDSVTFVLLAPNKSDIFLLGDFNNWQTNSDYQMKKDGEYFWITLNNLQATDEYAYQYLIDYQIKIADPYSEKILDPSNDQNIPSTTYPNLKSYPEGLTEGNVSSFTINQENYTWDTNNFDRPEQNNLVIYEMLVRDFTSKSSYEEALSHLDYLENLGINAIELMPINEFEGNDSWGYNPSFYMALDKAYGTKNAFKKFIDECHKRGIAVLADVVFNHSFSQSPLLQMYWNNTTNKPASDNPWYNESHNLVDNTSAHWGYDFNHTSSYTKAFFKDVLTYWITEYKIDGFRFDFTKGFSNTIYSGANNWASTYDAERIAILKEYSDHVWNTEPTDKPYVIFEHLSDNNEETELANYGILLWGNLNHSYTENTMGYGDNIDWISYKNRGWDSPNVLGYMESHDEERMMFKNLEYGKVTDAYSVKNLNTALSRQEAAGLFLFGIPGPKMIWQFGELGYEISIDENGRTGKKPIHWDYLENPNRKHIYDTWSTILAFKKKYQVFNSLDFDLNVGDLGKSILLKDAEMDVVIIGNFDVTSKTISTSFSKTGLWYEYFSGEEKSVNSLSENITLNPGSYKMFTTKKVFDPRGGTANDDSDNDGVVDTLDNCPNTISGATVDENGCVIFTLPNNNFTIETSSETCIGENNGSISIASLTTSDFTLWINNTTHDFTESITIDNLEPNNYTFCITSTEDASYEQCYELEISAAASLKTEIKTAKTLNSLETEILINSGTAPYSIYKNNQLVETTNNTSTTINTTEGDFISINTSKQCEGKSEILIHEKLELIGAPNPTISTSYIYLKNNYSKKVLVTIYNTIGRVISSNHMEVIDDKIQIDFTNKPIGMYYINVTGNSTATVKIIKQ
jgi:glycosidase